MAPTGTNFATSEECQLTSAAVPLPEESTSPLLREADAEDWGNQYSKLGYAFPIPVLSEAETELVRRHLEAYEDAVGAGPSHPLRGDGRFKIHLLMRWAWDLVHHPTVLEVVRTCLRTNDIWCWSSDLNIKESQSRAHYTWHQDSTYTGIHPPDGALTVWLALTPSNVESGCLFCLPQAAHELQQLPHTTGHGGDDNVLALRQEVAAWPGGLDPRNTQAIVLRPGQASVHSFLSVHASHPNRSGHRRVGLAIRYMSAHCRKVGGMVQEMATLVSGEGRGLFVPEPRPMVDLGETERGVHAIALELERRNYLPPDHMYR